MLHASHIIRVYNPEANHFGIYLGHIPSAPTGTMSDLLPGMLEPKEEKEPKEPKASPKFTEGKEPRSWPKWEKVDPATATRRDPQIESFAGIDTRIWLDGVDGKNWMTVPT